MENVLYKGECVGPKSGEECPTDRIFRVDSSACKECIEEAINGIKEEQNETGRHCKNL